MDMREMEELLLDLLKTEDPERCPHGRPIIVQISNADIARSMEIEKEMKMAKYPLLIITGPTAVGKTELSLKIAEKVRGEIISADSMQIYRFMDIGTAKASVRTGPGLNIT